MRVGQWLGGFAAMVLIVGLGACSADDGSSGSGGTAAGGTSGGAAGTASGGAAGSTSGGAAGSTSGGAAGTASGGAAGSASGGAAGTASGGAAGSAGSAGSAALATVGSLVVLGDSIGDGGGQAPFYYDLLKQDLTAKYGAITYKNNAQSGSKTSALKGQINGLPGSLPGPVAVCITSGGNDMKDQLLQIVAGLDGPARAQVGANISAALSSLLQPGRFGAGVEVHVFEANIYDASDGQGNFASAGCAFGSGFPALPTDGYFASWNGEIEKQVLAKGQWAIDLHQLFRLHGFNHPPKWYANDCTHPNATGHDQLRRHFYFKITGQTLP